MSIWVLAFPNLKVDPTSKAMPSLKSLCTTMKLNANTRQNSKSRQIVFHKGPATSTSNSRHWLTDNGGHLWAHKPFYLPGFWSVSKMFLHETEQKTGNTFPQCFLGYLGNHYALQNGVAKFPKKVGLMCRGYLLACRLPRIETNT